MKKLIAVLLTLAITLGLTAVVFANPGQNPNRNPGSPEVTSGSYTVRVTGGGNNLRIDILRGGVVVYPSVPRAGNGTFSQTFTTTSDHDIFIQVQGNSLRSVTVTAPPEPDEPYIVDEYELYRFVTSRQVDSKHTGISEVEGSRILTGLNVSSTVDEVNFSHHIANATGSGVNAGFVATGTLRFQLVDNYLEQFEQVYKWVDVTVWSDGTREEVVRAGSEHVRGGLVDGEAYSSKPFDGSRDIDVRADGLFLTRGSSDNGQGQGFPRSGSITSGGFTVVLYLANQSPRVDVTSHSYNLAGL